MPERKCYERRPLDSYAITTTDGMRGSGNLIEPPADFNSESSVTGLVRLQAREPGVVAQMLGVTLGTSNRGPTPTDPGADLEWNALRAVIKWGIGATNFQAEADFIAGTQIAVMAETLEVGVKYVRRAPLFALPLTSTAPTYLVSAGVGYHSQGRNSNPARLTEPIFLQGNLDQVILPVPEFAISFMVVPILNPAGQQNINAELRTFGAGGFRASYTFSGAIANAGQQNMENAFPIWNGARFLSIINPYNNAYYAMVVWGLAL